MAEVPPEGKALVGEEAGMTEEKQPISQQEWYIETEGILYNYPALDSQIEAIQTEIEELLPDKPTRVIKFDHNRGSTTHDSTADYALKRVFGGKAQELKRLQAVKRNVRQARGRMTYLERRVIDLTYRNRYSTDKIRNILHIGKTTYHKLKNEAVTLVAMHVGVYKQEEKGELNAN